MESLREDIFILRPYPEDHVDRTWMCCCVRALLLNVTNVQGEVKKVLRGGYITVVHTISVKFIFKGIFLIENLGQNCASDD